MQCVYALRVFVCEPTCSIRIRSTHSIVIFLHKQIFVSDPALVSRGLIVLWGALQTIILWNMILMSSFLRVLNLVSDQEHIRHLNLICGY